jgi:ketosteroid isomerase-like protein
LETQSREAALKADASFLESHLTSDFIRVFPDGSMTDRQEMIDRAKSGGLKYSSIDVKDEKIRAYGDNTAVVVATSSVKGTRDGKPLDGDYRSTRVWVKDGGQWKLASFQSTKIAPM